MSTLFPAPAKIAWVARPVDGYGRELGPPVVVRATTEATAREAAREWLAHLGFRQARRCQLIVFPYQPQRDPALRGFIQEVKDGTAD